MSLCLFVDHKIGLLTQQALTHIMCGNKDRALRLMDRKLIAQGIRHMYRQFRLQKWYESQLLVSEIIQSLRPNDNPRPVQQPTDPDDTYEDEVRGHVQTVIVVNCNFYRSGWCIHFSNWKEKVTDSADRVIMTKGL